MSRKKRRKKGKREERPASPARERRPGRRRWWPAAAVITGVLVVFAVVSLAGPRGGRSSRATFPEPPEVPVDSGPTYEDFVGSDACAECHIAEYAAWKGSTHGNAGGPPGPVQIIAPFDGEPIRFSDAVVTPLRTDDGRYVFRVEEYDGPVRLIEVAQVVGKGHMTGGGTQGFFQEFPDGTLRFLPFDYSQTQGAWFCQTGGRSDRGWSPITPDMPLSACSDWPATRVLGSHERFVNCQQCHGSQIRLEYDARAKRYDTRFTTFAVNCESCHGPAKRHVEIVRSDYPCTDRTPCGSTALDRTTARVPSRWRPEGSTPSPARSGKADSAGICRGRRSGSADIGMSALATLDEDASLRVCFQCHAVKEEIRPGYLPGKPLEEHFSLMLPLLSFRPYFPDGRIRAFAYQQQHVYSDCYLNGTMTCVDCHDPHSQRYRDIWGEPLMGRFDDGQCTDCHASKAGSPERHTRHQPGSPGSFCVACHMPYLQEPDVGDHLPYARSDHTIPIPRPGLDAVFGIDNACQKCHAELTPGEIAEQVREWYGELKPVKRLVEGLILSQRARDRDEAAPLMLTREGDYAALQFTGLSYFLLGYLSPNMPALEAEIVDRLKELAVSDDVDLQALALASLHLARGSDGATRRFLAERLEALAEQDMAVRRRWVEVLNFRGEAYRARGEARNALTAFEKAREILPDDPIVLRDVGLAQVDLEAYAEAVESFRLSLAADSLQPLVLASLGYALTARGDREAGLAAYRAAIEINPGDASTWLSLGNALMGSGRVESAIEAFERAVEVGPGRADAYFALGAGYARQDRVQEAITALNRSLELNPRAAGARRLLSSIVTR